MQAARHYIIRRRQDGERWEECLQIQCQNQSGQSVSVDLSLRKIDFLWAKFTIISVN